LKTLTPNPSSQRERGAYFLIFKLILDKGFKNSKFYFETVMIPKGEGVKER
jgi:hypothetical protein